MATHVSDTELPVIANGMTFYLEDESQIAQIISLRVAGVLCEIDTYNEEWQIVTAYCDEFETSDDMIVELSYTGESEELSHGISVKLWYFLHSFLEMESGDWPEVTV